MSHPSISSLCAGLLLAALCHTAAATGDAAPKPPTAPVTPVVDKSERCVPAEVTQCRATCERKVYPVTDKNEVAKKQYECKQDCIRGC
jgi:hypothetical protein